MSIMMNVDRGYIGVVFLILFLVFILFSWSSLRKKDWRSSSQASLREIQAYKNLKRSIDMCMELGQRIHLVLGWASITSTYSPSGLIGLSILKQTIQKVAHGDRAPLTTCGDGSLLVLAQDTTHLAYEDRQAQENYEYFSHQVSGVEPFAFATGSLPAIYQQDLTATVLTGHFGIESALIIDASEKQNELSVAGSDELTSQAVMIATCDNPLIGEELYAGGAYLQVNPMHLASLSTQDVFRWVLVIIMIVGSLLKYLGVI
jgi:hypothetical protein